MKLGNKGQVKTWLVGLLASAIVVTGGFFNSNLDNVLAALPSRLNDRQMLTFVDLGFNQVATRVVISGGQLMLDSTVNIEIGDVQPQLDNTDIQAVSLWARNVAPGDTSVFVDSDGHLQVDILSGGGGLANVDDPAGATDEGSIQLYVRDNVLTTLIPADGDYVRGRVDTFGALWVNNQRPDVQFTTQNAISATAVGTQIDTSGAVSAMIHVTTDGTWNRNATMLVKGFFGEGGALPSSRTLPIIAFQFSGIEIQPRSAVQPISVGQGGADNTDGFLVDLRGIQGLETQVTISGGGVNGTMSVHVHLVYNGDGVFNTAMALNVAGAAVPLYGINVMGRGPFLDSQFLPLDIHGVTNIGEGVPITAEVDADISANSFTDGRARPFFTDAFGALWVNTAAPTGTLVTQSATASGNGTDVNVSGYSAALIHTDSTSGDRTGLMTVQCGIGGPPPATAFKDISGWDYGAEEIVSLTSRSVASSEIEGYLVDVRGCQTLRTVLAGVAGTAGTIDIHVHPVSGTDGLIQSMSLQRDGGTPPPVRTVVAGVDGSNLVQELRTDGSGRLELPGNTAAAMVDNTDPTTGRVGSHGYVFDGSFWDRQRGDSVNGTLVNLGLNNDVTVSSSALPTGAATSALQSTANGILTTIDVDIGILAGAVSGTEMQVDILTSALPTGAATSALQSTANGILTTIDVDIGILAGTVSGSEQQVDIVASLPAGSNNIGDIDVLSVIPGTSATALGKAIDDATGATDTGVAALVKRVDVLVANAEVNADGDYTWTRVDNFGAVWTHENNAVQELGITELIGINEQVDPAEYGASVTTTLEGTGVITKVCLIATEEGSGGILKPNGTLILFDTDPTIAFGDASITAGERVTILAQLTFSDTDYQEDANGASNCQATEETYHTSTVFASWFLAAGEPSFNDVAGDDEKLELNVLYSRDSL